MVTEHVQLVGLPVVTNEGCYFVFCSVLVRLKFVLCTMS